MLIVAPIPPVVIFALPVLYTSTPLTPSDAKLPKSKALEPPPPPLEDCADGMVRPFKVTMLLPAPKPRTDTSPPSPLLRLIDTPVLRCKDSARLVSGNLPISSALIASTTPADSRLISIARSRDARIPVTTTSSTAASPCARTEVLKPVKAVEATTVANSFFLKLAVLYMELSFLIIKDLRTYCL